MFYSQIEIDNGRTVAPDEGRQNTSVSKPPSKIGSNRALIGFGSRAPRMVHSDRGTGKSQLRGVDDVLNVSPRLFKARPAPKVGLVSILKCLICSHFLHN